MVPSNESEPSQIAGSLPVPTPVYPAPHQSPAGNRLVRGLDALLHGRLPYRFQTTMDRFLASIGVPYKRVRLKQYQVLVRRNTWDENATARIITNQDYTPTGHEIQPTDTVIDIGANIGCFALVAAELASKGRVIAFEPNLDNFNLLTRNIELNGFANVIVERSAVSGTPGTLKLFRGTQSPLHTTIPSRLDDSAEAEEVPATTLQQIMDKYKVERCGFLKMNCEGAEYAILYNTPPEYLRRIDRITLEYHATEEKERVSRELARFLTQQGFKIFEFSDFVGFDCGFIRATRDRLLTVAAAIGSGLPSLSV